MSDLVLPPAEGLLDVDTIYLEPGALEYPRGREILERFPGAARVEVPSHWNIPGLHGNEGNVRDWVRIKRAVLVLGVKKSISSEPYERSCDFVAPSTASGCAMACSYCYVPRRKGFANPITVFVNIEPILAHLERHARKRGPKSVPTQADERLWVYELGTNSDLSVDATLGDNVRDLVALFRGLENAKATFATKFVNRDLLGYDPRGKTRIRFSLMPERVSRVVDVRTSGVPERIRAVNDFVEAGYEVNLNLGPVIYTDSWLSDYAELFDEVDDVLSPQAKAQIKAEVIFLTHNDRLHEVNLGWHPRGEALLWRPELQEEKVSSTGGRNVRYRRGLKRTLVDALTALLRERLPYCKVRYAF